MEPNHIYEQNLNTDAIPPRIRDRMPYDSGIATAPERVYLNSLNYFRGLAILFIIAGHAFQLSGWHVDAFYEKMAVNLIKGGTAFFVFISGYLFHHIFARNFRYRKFMIKKVRSVLMPYLVVSAPWLIYYVILRQGGPHADLIYRGGQGLWAQYLQPTVAYLWTGRLFDAYWYVPFIMIVFALSPLFLSYITMSLGTRLTLLAATLAVSLLIQRPPDNISVTQSVIYFIPVYLMGMNVSLHKDRVLKFLSGREWLPAAGILALSAWQVAFYSEYENLHKDPLVWAGLDLMLLQKMLGCLFFYALLSRFEFRDWRWLKALAASSFALYFLHPPVILLIKKSGILAWSPLHEVPGIVMWGMWTLAVTGLSFLIAAAVRRLFPKHSRQVIGW